MRRITFTIPTVAAVTTAALALALATPASAHSPTTSAGATVSCSVHALPEPDGSVNSEVHDAAPGGRWAVGSAIVSGSEHTVVWKRGKLKSLAANPLASYEGVNNKGTIVGWGISGGTASAGAVVGGTYVPLASPAGAVNTYGVAVAGNRVAGHAELDSGTTWPVLWKLSDPDNPVLLPLPDGYLGFVVGFAKKGRVVVDAMNFSGETAGFVFTKKLKRTTLTAPMEGQVTHVAAAAGKRAVAWVEAANQAVVFNVRTGAGTTVATPIQVNATNAAGVMGGSYVESREPGMIVDGVSTKLPGLVEGGFGTVSAITKAGNPAGIVERSGGAEAAVLWSCSS